MLLSTHVLQALCSSSRGEGIWVFIVFLELMRKRFRGSTRPAYKVLISISSHRKERLKSTRVALKTFGVLEIAALERQVAAVKTQ